MTREGNEVEQAVARTVRDSLEKLQHAAEELNQAVNDVAAACGSSRPANVLPPMLRAQTAAASLSASLEVLSRFVAASLQLSASRPLLDGTAAQHQAAASAPAAVPTRSAPQPVPARPGPPAEAVPTPQPVSAPNVPGRSPVQPPAAVRKQAPGEVAVQAPPQSPIRAANPAPPQQAHVQTKVPASAPVGPVAVPPLSPALEPIAPHSAAPPVPAPPLSVVPPVPPAVQPAVPTAEPVLASDPIAVELPSIEELTPFPEPLQVPGVAESAASGAAFDLSGLPPEEQELHRRANRVAKVSMQDIKLLRPNDVKLGREHKDLCLRLRDDIDKAHKEYDRRFQAILGHPVDYFYDRMVEILGEGNPETLGEYPYPSPVLRH